MTIPSTTAATRVGASSDDLRGRLDRTTAWRARRIGAALLGLLLLTDLAFIVAHLADAAIDAYNLPELQIDRDGAVPEIYGYLKALWSGLVLLVLARRLRDPLLVVLAGLVGVVVLDDAGQLHEAAGDALAGSLAPLATAALPADTLGQFTYFAAVGTVAVVVVALVWQVATDAGQVIAVGVLGALGLLGFAAAGIDLVDLTGIWDPIFEVLEDGTELVALTLLLAHVAGWWDLLTDPVATTRPAERATTRATTEVTQR